MQTVQAMSSSTLDEPEFFLPSTASTSSSTATSNQAVISPRTITPGNAMLIRIDSNSAGSSSKSLPSSLKSRRGGDAVNNVMDLSLSRASSESLKKASTRKQTFPPRSPTLPATMAEEQKTKRARTLVLKLDSADGQLRFVESKNHVAARTQDTATTGTGEPVVRRVVVNQAGNIQQRHIQTTKPANESANTNDHAVFRGTLTKPGAITGQRQRRKRRTKQEMDAIRAEISRQKEMRALGNRRRRGPHEQMQGEARRLDLHAVRNSVVEPEQICSMQRLCSIAGDSRTPCWHPAINGRLSSHPLPTLIQVANWSVSDVCAFITHLGMDENVVRGFGDQLIDGEALLLLTRCIAARMQASSREDLVSQLAVKLGPAVKLHNSLLRLKHVDAGAGNGRS